ncbi:GNAT family N-acetyltransferase [Agrobacterium rubi]|nr:GNAT family N-acetyltransferase [Agrobacterium rubi]NTF24140.1 GNAT family N-acetyltransferase [Agrobacterium rubi]
MSAAATMYISNLLRKISVEESISSTRPLSTRRRSEVSVFAVKDKVSIASVISSLDEATDDRWEWEKWFTHAYTSGSPTIGIRDVSSDTIVGFASIDQSVAVRPSSPRIIDLDLEITSVYVRPDFRGKGYGAILRRAATSHLETVLDRLANLSEEDVADHGLVGLSVTVSSHPESHEGLAFAQRLCTDVGNHLSSLSQAAWFGAATLIDETDPEEALSMD